MIDTVLPVLNATRLVQRNTNGRREQHASGNTRYCCGKLSAMCNFEMLGVLQSPHDKQETSVLCEHAHVNSDFG